MTNPLVKDTVLLCNYGSSPSLLTPLAAQQVAASEKPFGTIFDVVPGENFDHFGTCAVDGNPCKPNTPLPWDVDASRLVLGAQNAITTASELRCMKSDDTRIIALTGDEAIFLENFKGTVEKIVEKSIENWLVDVVDALLPAFGKFYWAYGAAKIMNDKDCQSEPLEHPIDCWPGLPPISHEPPLNKPPLIPVIAPMSADVESSSMWESAASGLGDATDKIKTAVTEVGKENPTTTTILLVAVAMGGGWRVLASSR